jgi:hypothetical protein
VAATPFLHWGTDVQARSTCIGHGDRCWKEETLDELKRKKMMQRKEKLIRVFYPRQTCFIYKYALMGLYKGTVQNIITGSYMLPSADDKRKINVKVRGKT